MSEIQLVGLLSHLEELARERGRRDVERLRESDRGGDNCWSGASLP